MKTLKDLYDYARDKNIVIRDYNFGGDTNWKGHCIFNNQSNCLIFLNNSMDIDNIQRKCILAHEIGHFTTNIIQNDMLSCSKSDTLIRSINDFRANKWAVNELIPLETFKYFLNTNMSKYDVAKKLEVTNELLELACYVYEPFLNNLSDYYKNKKE